MATNSEVLGSDLNFQQFLDLFYSVAMSVRSSAGLGILRWRHSQPGIRPRPYTCQARAESFPHAAVRGNMPDPLLHCLFGGTPLPRALSRLSRSPRLFLATQG